MGRRMREFKNTECHILTSMAISDNRNFSMATRSSEFPIPLYHVVTRVSMGFAGVEEIGAISKIESDGGTALISGEVNREGFIESLPFAHCLLWLNENGTTRFFRFVIVEDHSYPEDTPAT